MSQKTRPLHSVCSCCFNSSDKLGEWLSVIFLHVLIERDFQFYVFRRDLTKEIYEYRSMAKAASKSTLFGRRLREARLQFGIPQDKLGVIIGLDESCSSARMSRYESGVHEPAFKTIEKIALALNLPTAYFFCEDDRLAKIINRYQLSSEQNRQLIADFIETQT